MKGVTFENTAQRQPASAEEAKSLDGSKGIGGTGWIKAALSRKQRRDTALVEADQKKCDLFHTATLLSLPFSPFSVFSSEQACPDNSV